MLRSYRSLFAPDLNAHHSVTAILHPSLRLHFVDCHNVINEDRLIARGFPRINITGRPTLTLLLDGEARIDRDGRSQWLTRAEPLLMDDKLLLHMRQSGAPYRALALEWQDGFLGPRPAAFTRLPTLSFDMLAEIERCVIAMSQPTSDLRATVAAFIALMRSAGADLTLPERARDDEPERAEAQLTDALDRLLSDLRSQPMTTDLESATGLSGRQLQRVISEYHNRYGFNASQWIDARNRRRLMMALSFLCAPGATVPFVAALVGYQSTTALARAMNLAGYPPPSQVSAMVSALRDAPL